MLYGYDLQSTNTQSSNYPAIDLIDNVNKIVIQVTSNTSTNKIKEILEKIKKTNYEEYKIIFLYLCDEIPSNTRKKIKEFNCECLCFIDLIRGFQNNQKAIEIFISQIEQKDIYQRLCEYLILPNQWDFDEKGAFCKLDPNFEIIDIEAIEPFSNDSPNYDWLNSINAISKHYNAYKNKTLPTQYIEIRYNHRKIHSTFLYYFYNEKLTIATPSPCYLGYIDKIEVYLESYICYDRDFRNNINSRLTYFYQIIDCKQILPFDKFVNRSGILRYKKYPIIWIPIIFFENQKEHKNFIDFAKTKLPEFDYQKVLKTYEYIIDKNWQNKDSLLNCCIHFWAYDLYWSAFI